MKNSPFGCPPIPPSIKVEADCFPGRKNRKQAGPTQGGAEILIYRDKKKIAGKNLLWDEYSPGINNNRKSSLQSAGWVR